MTSINVQFIRKSRNDKTGAIPVTNSDRHSCPDSCPLKDNGCYASAGLYTRQNWDKVTSGERGSDWDSLCADVAKLPDGQLWRHNVSGDLPHTGERIDGAKVSQLVAANKGKRGFTYTHHNMAIPQNYAAVQHANQHGFTINLSANNINEADQLAALNIGPVVAIVPADTVDNTETPAGRKVVICPATYRDNVSCETCKMCAVADRKTIIGFPAHGSQKGKIDV